MIVPVQECNTCMEEISVSSCFHENCDWVMCKSCSVKWYTHNLKCPACRNVNRYQEEINKHVKNVKGVMEASLIIVVYFCVFVVLILLGRMVSILFKLGPPNYWCDDWFVFIECSLLGSVVILVFLVLYVFWVR